MLLAFAPASGIYDISVPTLNGTTLNMNALSGKKIVVVEFDAATYDKAQLLTLDSLQRGNVNIQVIAVPAKDFSEVSVQSVQTLVTSLNVLFVVTQPGYVKKSAGSNQHPIFQWLTHASANTHFDNDADQPGQIYIISEKGEVYAVLRSGTNNSLLKRLVMQHTN